MTPGLPLACLTQSAFSPAPEAKVVSVLEPEEDWSEQREPTERKVMISVGVAAHTSTRLRHKLVCHALELVLMLTTATCAWLLFCSLTKICRDGLHATSSRAFCACRTVATSQWTGRRCAMCNTWLEGSATLLFLHAEACASSGSCMWELRAGA